MNRIAAITIASIFSSVLWAQSVPVTSIRIGSNTVPTARFMVDGQTFQGIQTFMWPKGSKHVVQTFSDIAPAASNCPASLASAIQLSPGADTAVLISGWIDNTGHLIGGADNVQTVTADPAITSLIANVTVAYRVILNLFNTQPNTQPQFCQPTSPGAPGAAPDQVRPGIVYVDGPAYWSSAILYLPAGSHILNAFAFPGFVFTGWSVNGSASSAYLNTVDIEAPIVLVPGFVLAKRVRFLTNPMGLQVLVDRSAAQTTPYLNTSSNLTCPPEFTHLPQPPPGIAPLCFGDFDFVPGSSHVIGAPPTQKDINGKVWVFDAWKSGGGENTVYTADTNVSAMDTMTANFMPGAVMSFYTSPPGLPLNVDGRSNWPSGNFVWGLGSTHNVSAATTTTDSKGRKYSFKSWTNSGPAAQQITVDQAAVDNGFRMTASYDVLSRVVVQTSPPGLMVQVDGNACQSPCTVDRPNGSQVRLTAPSSVPINDSSRMDFTSWSDSSAADRVLTINTDWQTVTANYQTMYRLSAASSPTNGAALQFSPVAPDMFYPAGQPVAVTAQANPGFKFRRWGGDMNGTYPAGQVSMAQPSSIMAMLDTVPYIAPTGVQNAAGVTPDQVVAPGSIITIQGASLTTDTFTGPTNPLAQTLGGIVVTIGDRMLPLLMASPNQVNAQLPPDLTEGDYTLTVSATGQPDVTGRFTVARNAPGLFVWSKDSRAIALAVHQDGTPITPDSPAIQGETVTIYGTGFGPCQQPLIAGFLDPNAGPNPLVDSLTIQLGDFTPQAVFTGAAPDRIGMEITQFKITPDFPAATTLSLTLVVNGRQSNSVLLPLQ